MAVQTATVKKFDVKWIHYAITAIIVFGSQFLPQMGPITPMGGAVLGTFIGVIYGWTFLDMLWPSIIGLIGLGYAVGMTSVLGASFGSPIIPMILMTFATLTVMTETKLTDVIAKLFVANRFTKGHPWMFVFFFMLGGYFCAQINVFVSMILMSSILLDMCKKLGIKPFTPFPAVMLAGLALSIQMGQIMIPFRGTALTLVAAYNAMTGGMPNFILYMAFIIPVGILMLILYTLICRFVFRVDVEPLKAINDETFGPKGKMTKDQKIALFFLFFMMFMLLATSILPKTWIITIFLNKITMFGQAAIVILVYMLVKKEDGTKFFNYSYCAAKGVSWDAIFMTAFIMPVSNFMTAEGTGIKEGLSMLLAPLSNFSPIIFIVLVMLFAGIVTNIANNVVLAVVILPVVVTFAGQMGMAPLGVACILFIVTQLALFTPGASVFSGMAFAQSDWVKAPMMMKYAAIAVVIMIILCLAVAIPYSYLLF